MTKRTVNKIPKYGDHDQINVIPLQDALREAAFDPGTSDGWFGDKTLKALQAFQKANKLPGTGVIPADGGYTFDLLKIDFVPADEHTHDPGTPPKSDNFFGAPHIGANIDLLGRTETDPVLNARYVPEWKLEGLNYTALAGNTHPWCSVRANADRRKVGIKGTGSAGASSWSSWGKKCPFWFGAALDIRHKSGGRHIADFLYWIDESKKIAAMLGGNQSNRFSIVSNNLSGGGDKLVSGPRWSTSLPDGQFVSMAQVLAKYPFLKVGGSGGSTR